MGKKNQKRNIIWTEIFDAAFKKNDCKDFLTFANEKSRLKPLFEPSSQVFTIDFKIEKNKKNTFFNINKLSINASTKNAKLSIIADKTAHIQVENSSLGNLFISREELEKKNKLTEVDKNIIANGTRGLDPFDQEDWVKTIGKTWPTAQQTRDPNGVVKLSIDKRKKGIFLDTDKSITAAYGTKPRAMAILDNENNSIVFSFQQENYNPEINFAAWSILPFKIRDGKKTLAIFPSKKKNIESFKNEEDDSLEELKNSDQWAVEQNKFFVVDVSIPSEKTEYIDSYADWCIFATQGDDTICLIRSCYKDKSENKQFKIFSGEKNLGGTKYTEIEFIAPKVPFGEKSTLVYRIDFIPVETFGITSLNEDNMEESMLKIGEIIYQRIKWARALARLTLQEKV